MVQRCRDVVNGLLLVAHIGGHAQGLTSYVVCNRFQATFVQIHEDYGEALRNQPARASPTNTAASARQ